MKTNTKLPSNDYLTKNDLNDSLKIFKDDLNQTMKKQTQEFTEVVSDLMLKVGLKFDEQDKRFEQIDQKFKQVRKDISESSLMIIDELKTSREEQIVLGYRQSEHTNQIKDHQTRISTLEDNYQVTT